MDPIITNLSKGIKYSDENLIIEPSFANSEQVFLDKKLIFTNMIPQRNSDINEYIKGCLIYFKENFYNKLSELNQATSHITHNNNNNRNRIVEKICEKYNWQKDELNPEDFIEGFNLFKLNFKETEVNIGKNLVNSFRIYAAISYDNQNVPKFKLLFIDPHHLVIPSRYTRSGVTIRPEDAYKETIKKVGSYKGNIKMIIAQIENQAD